MATNLRRRIVTAFVLGPIVVALVLGAGTQSVAWAFGVVIAGAAWEWAGLCGGTAAFPRILYVVLTACALVLVEHWWNERGVWAGLNVLAVLWWLAALGMIVVAERRRSSSRCRGRSSPPGWSLPSFVAGWLVLVPTWSAVVGVHGRSENGPARVLMLLVVIWAADVAAYAVGRRFGRRRLAPSVSPGKSWEGFAGGVFAAGLAGAAVGAWAGLPGVVAAALAVLVGAFSVIGDLAESLFKRRAGLKDSGGILPGHGGILDRIDSLTAGAPAFALVLGWFGS